jgi:hypothetical protein
MTLFMAYPVDRANPFRGLLPLWIGSGVYALLLLAGNRLLLDPDTMWQVTVGQWILDHRAVPVTGAGRWWWPRARSLPPLPCWRLG